MVVKKCSELGSILDVGKLCKSVENLIQFMTDLKETG